MKNVHRRSLYMVAFLLVVLMSPVQAQVISNFTGAIDGTEPTSPQLSSDCESISDQTGHFYETFEAFVTETGTYSYTDISIDNDLDMQLSIYTPSYDPNNALSNCVIRMDDDGSVNLTMGTPYVFVVQPLTDTNIGDWEFEMDGPGNVQQGALPVEPVEPVGIPTLSTWAMLLLSILLMGGGMKAVRRD